jgi:hypothetical protein
VNHPCPESITRIVRASREGQHSVGNYGISNSPLYLMNPNFLKRFMKKLTRERLVPTISARVSWLIFGKTFSGLPSLPNRAKSKSMRASPFSLELKVDQPSPLRIGYFDPTGS